MEHTEIPITTLSASTATVTTTNYLISTVRDNFINTTVGVDEQNFVFHFNWLDNISLLG